MPQILYLLGHKELEPNTSFGLKAEALEHYEKALEQHKPAQKDSTPLKTEFNKLISGVTREQYGIDFIREDIRKLETELQKDELYS